VSKVGSAEGKYRLLCVNSVMGLLLTSYALIMF